MAWTAEHLRAADRHVSRRRPSDQVAATTRAQSGITSSTFSEEDHWRSRDRASQMDEEDRFRARAGN
jgi:hypothetical protein